MKIVIDIPKKTYDAIKERNIITCGETFAHKLVNCIKNGTPLPKRHGRLIDADSFVQEHPLAFVRDVINDAPTIIEADKGVLEKIAETQNSLESTCKAWDEAIEKDGYVN